MVIVGIPYLNFKFHMTVKFMFHSSIFINNLNQFQMVIA